MKNYDLSEYVLRDGDVIMFPLTKQEISILAEGRNEFEKYFKMPFVAGYHGKDVLTRIANGVNMDNDYWFMDSLWIVVDAKSKEIYGTIRYEKNGEVNKIIKNITLFIDAVETYNKAIELFARFLSVNNYLNIVIEEDKECYEG